jgi:hypothetical protein
MEITTIEITEGRKKADLKKSFPFRRLLFNKMAIIKAIPVVKGMVPTTKNMVFFKAMRKTSSWNALM